MVNHCEKLTDPKEFAKCFYKATGTWALCLEACAPNNTMDYEVEPSEMNDQLVTYGPCTQKCTRAFNDTMVNHCDPITNPKDQAQCFFKAAATLFACFGACANNTIEYEVPEFSPATFAPEGSK